MGREMTPGPTAFLVACKQVNGYNQTILTYPKQRVQQVREDGEGQTARPCQGVWAHGQDTHLIPADGGLNAGAGGRCCSEPRGPPVKQGLPSLFKPCDKQMKLQRPDQRWGLSFLFPGPHVPSTALHSQCYLSSTYFNTADVSPNIPTR